MKTALIIIDIQNDYFPGGKMELDGSIGASQRAQEVLSAFRERKMPLVHIQHLSTRLGATFLLANTHGVEIHDSVQPLSGETLVQKSFPNSFRDTPLFEHLTRWGVEGLVIVGMMTHMCVDATTRAAFDHGFTCTVLQDACATRALSYGEIMVPARYVHAASLAALGAVYAKVMDTADFISHSVVDD